MEVICLEDSALLKLIENVVERLMEVHGMKEQRWIGEEEAMKLLHIKSKTSLLKLRQEGKIRYSMTLKKNFLYDRDSINAYISKQSVNPFRL